MTRATKKASEVWFEHYAAEHGIDGGEAHEPRLGGTSKPDYRISRGGAVAIADVKEFDRLRDPGALENATGYRSPSSKEIVGRMRNAIKDCAKKQLREYAPRGEPLIVVLANPKGAMVPLEDPAHVWEAMYGDQGVAFAVAVDGEPLDEAPIRPIFMRDGAFGKSDHDYVSAVVTLHRRSRQRDAVQAWEEVNRHRWEGIEDRVEAVKASLRARERDDALREAEAVTGAYYVTRTYSTRAVAEGKTPALPPELFAGQCDERYVYDLATGLPLLVG